MSVSMLLLNIFNHHLYVLDQFVLCIDHWLTYTILILYPIIMLTFQYNDQKTYVKLLIQMSGSDGLNDLIYKWTTHFKTNIIYFLNKHLILIMVILCSKGLGYHLGLNPSLEDKSVKKLINSLSKIHGFLQALQNIQPSVNWPLCYEWNNLDCDIKYCFSTPHNQPDTARCTDDLHVHLYIWPR